MAASACAEIKRKLCGVHPREQVEEREERDERRERQRNAPDVFLSLCGGHRTHKIVAIKFLQMKTKQGKTNLQSIVNEINIMKESIECPYVVE